MAYDAELDLVEVNSAANPSVAKIMDYGKYRYLQEKQESRQKSKSKGPQIKEVRLSFKISPHDLGFKTKQAQKFLDQGDKVKVAVKLKGREMMYARKIQEMLRNFAQAAGGTVVGPTERMGNRFSAVIEKAKDEAKNS